MSGCFKGMRHRQNPLILSLSKDARKVSHQISPFAFKLTCPSRPMIT